MKSTTVQGSRNHPRENVKANIIQANIPVANGVVHLIDKPLIIVASPLWDYLQEEVSLYEAALNESMTLFCLSNLSPSLHRKRKMDD